VCGHTSHVSGGFPLFGVCAFAFYGLYLLLAAIKGNFRLGLRLAFWKIFPMEIGKTKMSAFLANSWIILLCSVPSVQFCVDAFPLYARETQVDSTPCPALPCPPPVPCSRLWRAALRAVLFGAQVQHMRGLKYFWENNVFVFAMLCIVLVTSVYLVARPVDQAANIEAELQVPTHAFTATLPSRLSCSCPSPLPHPIAHGRSASGRQRISCYFFSRPSVAALCCAVRRVRGLSALLFPPPILFRVFRAAATAAKSVNCKCLLELHAY
jgi:hypothetical protein